MATHVANAAGEDVNDALNTIRQGDRFVQSIPGTRTGTANFSQLGVNGQGSGGVGQLHNRTGSGSSGSSGQQGGGLRFNPQLQARMFGGRTNTSRK